MAINGPTEIQIECDCCGAETDADSTEYVGKPATWGVDPETLQQMGWVDGFAGTTGCTVLNVQQRKRRRNSIWGRIPLYSRVLDGVSMKVCKDCKQLKSYTEYQKLYSGRDGYHPVCKPCHNVRAKRSIARGRTLFRKTGNSLELVKRKLLSSVSSAKRNGHKACITPLGLILRQFTTVCMVCSKDVGEDINLDHDHVTGEFRGFLCLNCNLGLGHLRESVEILKSMIEYVKRYESRNGA